LKTKSKQAETPDLPTKAGNVDMATMVADIQRREQAAGRAELFRLLRESPTEESIAEMVRILCLDGELKVAADPPEKLLPIFQRVVEVAHQAVRTIEAAPSAADEQKEQARLDAALRTLKQEWAAAEREFKRREDEIRQQRYPFFAAQRAREQATLTLVDLQRRFGALLVDPSTPFLLSFADAHKLPPAIGQLVDAAELRGSNLGETEAQRIETERREAMAAQAQREQEAIWAERRREYAETPRGIQLDERTR